MGSFQGIFAHLICGSLHTEKDFLEVTVLEILESNRHCHGKLDM